ncbi:MAG: long-chain acyl-CoA synthetase [Actinomycetota bacterium]|nr:long-chain acyl-CoA synthetase [Actinomycetota bacterium]
MAIGDIDAAVAGRTVPGLFAATVGARPDAVAVRWRPPGVPGGPGVSPEENRATETMTWAEYGDRACQVAAGLRDLGVRPGDRVLLMMRNRPEFHYADMGVLLAGGTPISIYTSSSPEQIQYLAGHSEAVAAIVGDVGLLERFLKVRSELPALAKLVLVDDPDGLAPSEVVPFGDLLGADPVDLAGAAATVRPEDLLTLIYTSGTTGPPKGVMISNRNVCWVLESMEQATGERVTGWRQVSYLPMAHIAERFCTHYLHIADGTDVTSCAEPAALASHLREVRPEHFLGVPRVWEKIHSGIMAAVSGDPEKLAGFERALEVGRKAAAVRVTGEPLPPALAAAWEQVDTAVFANIRALVGFDQCRIGITGAAPIPRPVFDFFLAIGLPMTEVYGLSECTGPMTWARTPVRPGTVGPPIPGQEIMLLDDGEVCCRGGNVFAGYLKDPDRTAEMLDGDGWLHTGDIGQFDEAGYLKIVDRKKELIITAGGKNISPANLEAAIKSYPLIGQACAVGDARPYMSALIVLDPDVAPAWAQSQGIGFSSLADLAEHPDVRAEVERCVAEANTRFSQVEQIKRIAILPTEWPPDSEELTPTMKLKRRGVLAKYAAEIEDLYN